MKMKTLSLTLGLSGTALAAALVLPALAQESLLPEGFGNPAETPAPRPTPTPSPTATPTPGSAPANGSAPPPVVPTSGTASASAPAETGEEGEEDEEVESGGLKYDLPPGARRLLTRIGPLTPETGGLAPDAFGVRGQYAAAIMGKTNGQFASRWGQILLRRSLASAIDTPDTINGADLAAARTALLLRMGESIIARRIVQSVDYDRASPRLVAAAQQTYLANADPAGMCPYVPAGLAHGDEQAWRLASAICSGLSGEAGPAGWAIGRVRSSGKISNFDILLTERVLGATGAGRRSTTIEWDNIDRLTSWRFGMATATAIPVPEALRTAAPSNIKSWTVLAPMTDMASRIAAAPEAAARGVLSSEAYVSLLSAAASEEEPAEALVTQTDRLRGAFRLAAGADRYAAMQQLWGTGGTPTQSYAAMVATARAAAALPVNTDVGGDPWQLLGSMLAGGYDENAIAWVPTVSVGSRAWAVLAVGSPRPLTGMSAGAVGQFAGDDDSADALRSKFLLAGLAGLGRLDASAAASAASDLEVDLGKQTRWSRAIMAAAERREPGMVALLAAAGMQGEWSEVPPYHLYYIVRALRDVGLAAEARMIAAEALVRV
ncbi:MULTISPECIES: hypothetical protein [unclassified Sphingopyxis]|uniref:hypothetical protein n=1 Tax=unclassified Sphingopyxis TaxID=2614943 RepID=UPI0007303731|nr:MULTISPECIES: hypothetical protein [unclassified Sphingopyxis]KTE01669.1 hypothetical protein ATE78_12900 [Sphingopyxis sp. H012]KTE11913.1 hypothetical protein ATE70_07680 [Sphingopyxis sp. H053]KTE16182.1 hypothetical protein ATE76_00375 [Sphingopyxis sp. H093]KTE29652.1 hypothetical protein ATE75_07015 [Sphingopyxis sp. H080]KTE34494.1 hypothetical protein ATE68_11685 [Sphingopyxis sp. H038]